MITVNKSKKENQYRSFLQGLKGIRGRLKARKEKKRQDPNQPRFGWKAFLITVLSTILLWSFLVSVIIYRNSYKEIVGNLAAELNFKGRREKQKTFEAIQAFILAPYHWVKALILQGDTPSIYIDIKFKHLQKLNAKFKKAHKMGRLVKGPDDFVPAQIRHGDKTIKVKLRLKGDWLDHLTKYKWSFRIHTKGDDHLFGARRFSIQDPYSRRFEAEVIFFNSLRRLGIIAPRYFFISVAINGKNIGLMAFEEHFAKELLESQNRKESVILKFDESDVWESVDGDPRGFKGVFDNYINARIAPFQENKIKRSPKLTDDLKIATGLLRGFINGSLPADRVFDVKLMGRYIAAIAAWGSWHAARWHNLRFYYNPITARLEPIGFDSDLEYGKRKHFYPGREPFWAKFLFQSPEAMKEYRITLKKLLKEIESGETEEWVDGLEKKSLKILHKEHPLLKGLSLFEFDRTMGLAIKKFESSLRRYPRFLILNWIESEGNDYLELINPLPHPVVIPRILKIDRNDQQETKLNLKTHLNFPLRIGPTSMGTLPTINKFYLKNDLSPELFQIVAQAYIEGEEKNQRTEEAIPFFPILKTNPLPSATAKQAITSHPYLTLEKKTKTFSVKKGVWEVNHWLALPQDYGLKIPSGVTLRFKESAGLLSHGPVNIGGTENEPVIMEGQGNGWQGIAVLQSGALSTWTHAIVRDTNAPNHKGWSLTGGVNFYESDIHMEHCRLAGNQSEDALNIVRSTFTLEEVEFLDAASDAFDSDFSNGTVTGGLFASIGAAGGGDGIDVSGSEVTVRGTRFKNIQDKALSVGEASRMSAENIVIEQAGAAAVSKDGSTLDLKDSTISGSSVAGLMAYIKKPEYGGATIIAENLTFASNKTRAIAQEGSAITIDGEAISPEPLDVDELYASAMKSGMK